MPIERYVGADLVLAAPSAGRWRSARPPDECIISSRETGSKLGRETGYVSHLREGHGTRGSPGNRYRPSFFGQVAWIEGSAVTDMSTVPAVPWSPPAGAQGREPGFRAENLLAGNFRKLRPINQYLPDITNHVLLRFSPPRGSAGDC